MTADLPPFALHGDEASPRSSDDWRDLFSELAAGRLAALDALYDAAAKRLYGLALWRTGSEEDAADIVHDVFVRVAEHGERLASVRNPRAWLLTVTHRAAIDLTRRRHLRAADSLGNYPFLTAVDDHGERMLDAAHVSVLLSALPESTREIVYLKHFAGCTFAEIGEIVGVPKFTAASRYRNGIEKLRKLAEGDHETR